MPPKEGAGRGSSRGRGGGGGGGVGGGRGGGAGGGGRGGGGASTNRWASPPPGLGIASLSINDDGSSKEPGDGGGGKAGEGGRPGGGGGSGGPRLPKASDAALAILARVNGENQAHDEGHSVAREQSEHVCAVCTEPLNDGIHRPAAGSCEHTDVCALCYLRLRLILKDTGWCVVFVSLV